MEIKAHFPLYPSISLPKGGGAIRGMGEKFAANPVTGTGSMSVPIATTRDDPDSDRSFRLRMTRVRATDRLVWGGPLASCHHPKNG